MSGVIEKLREDQEYYGGVGKQYLSNSDIGTLLKNPEDFGILPVSYTHLTLPTIE